jgi:hypothetical protein
MPSAGGARTAVVSSPASSIGPFDFAQGGLFAAKNAAQDDKAGMMDDVGMMTAMSLA